MDPVRFPQPPPALSPASGPPRPFESTYPDEFLSLVLKESGSASPDWKLALTFGGDGGAPFLVSHALPAGQALKSRTYLVPLVTRLTFGGWKHQSALTTTSVSPFSDPTLSQMYLDVDLPTPVNHPQPFLLPSGQDVLHLICLRYFADLLLRGSRCRGCLTHLGLFPRLVVFIADFHLTPG